MRISELFVSKKTAMNIRKICPKGEADKRIRLLGKQKSYLFAIMMIATIMIAIPVFVTDTGKLSDPVKSLKRNGYEEGDTTQTLRVVSDDGYEDTVTFDVKERGYTNEELDRFSESLDDRLWKDILGWNTDADNVISDLDLPSHIEGFPFDITWKSDRPLIVSSSGAIDKYRLQEEDPEDAGIAVRLCATLRYRERTEDKYSYIIVRKGEADKTKQMAETVAGLIKEADTDSASDEEMILPEGIGYTKLSFYRTGMNRGWAVLFIGIIAAILVMLHKDNDIGNEEKKRRDQMEEDHPKILNQYMLYYLAGMNPRAIWSGICSGYEERVIRSGKNKRYAYEEMLLARNRMEEGCSELASYDEFANRCDNVRYRAFISLVKQAVTKGNSGLEDLLYEEIDKAQREKNNRIRSRASEAETKLLLPMFMMLITVLVFVMVPAFMGLNE